MNWNCDWKLSSTNAGLLLWISCCGCTVQVKLLIFKLTGTCIWGLFVHPLDDAAWIKTHQQRQIFTVIFLLYQWGTRNLSSSHGLAFLLLYYFLFCFILFYSVLFCSVLFYAVLLYFILFYSVLLCFFGCLIDMIVESSVRSITVLWLLQLNFIENKVRRTICS